jgi:hypothetical protein
VTEEEIAAYYAAKGIVAVNHLDRAHMLGVIRENRRRYARDDSVKAQGEGAELLRKGLAELPTLNDPVELLLGVTSMLGAFAAEGMDLTTACNMLGFLADDMDREDPS